MKWEIPRDQNDKFLLKVQEAKRTKSVSFLMEETDLELLDNTLSMIKQKATPFFFNTYKKEARSLPGVDKKRENWYIRTHPLLTAMALNNFFYPRNSYQYRFFYEQSQPKNEKERKEEKEGVIFAFTVVSDGCAEKIDVSVDVNFSSCDSLVFSKFDEHRVAGGLFNGSR